MSKHLCARCCKRFTVKMSVAKIDKTHIDGKEINKHKNKKPKAGKKGFMCNAATKMLHPFIKNNIMSNSTLYINDNESYSRAYRQHRSIIYLIKQYVNGMTHTNRIESIWVLLKRGYNRTYHNSSMKHRGGYVNEFIFRLNERNCERYTVDRLADMVSTNVGKRITYQKFMK